MRRFTVILLSALLTHDLSAAEPLDIGSQRQLFLDDYIVDRTDGVERVVHQPKKYSGNPVIHQGQTTWNQYRSQLYGTVLYMPEERKFKMWYLSGARLPFDEPILLDGVKRIPNFQLVGYAESENGFKWKLPELGLVDYNGSKKNNICRIARTNVEGIAVLHDPRDLDPRRRYKAFYWEHSASNPEPAPGINGMSVSFSADGKSWTNEPNNPVIPHGSDTGQQALWDEALEKYVVFGRFNAGGRKVARAESEDFLRWSDPRLVFDADSRDPPGTQIYGMGVSRYEGVYVGMPWIFHSGSTHRIDVQLATSREGGKWTRVGERKTFIPNGPEGRWDAGIIFTAAQPVQVKGDRIFIFYSASSHDHNYKYLTELSKTDRREWRKRFGHVGTSIGVATLRRDGFVSLTASEEAGQIVTRPFVASGRKLLLNVDVHDAGEARVAVLDEQREPVKGFELISSIPIRGRLIEQTVGWSDEAEWSQLSGRNVRLQIQLRNADLYAFWTAKE